MIKNKEKSHSCKVCIDHKMTFVICFHSQMKTTRYQMALAYSFLFQLVKKNSQISVQNVKRFSNCEK